VANTINGFQGSGAASVGTSRNAQSAREAATTDNTQPDVSGGGSGEVHITSTASQLAALGQKLGAMPAVDAARVARISQALQNGTYSISADKIAGGLIQSDRALAQLGF